MSNSFTIVHTVTQCIECPHSRHPSISGVHHVICTNSKARNMQGVRLVFGYPIIASELDKMPDVKVPDWCPMLEV